VINCPFINVRKRLQTLNCTLKNAQLIVQLHGPNVQLYGQTSCTFNKSFHKRVFVRTFARSNVQLIATNVSETVFRLDDQLYCSIVIVRLQTFTNVYKRSIERFEACYIGLGLKLHSKTAHHAAQIVMLNFAVRCSAVFDRLIDRTIARLKYTSTQLYGQSGVFKRL
jgi:hypothetical protein